jgi:hypothetical protein
MMDIKFLKHNDRENLGQDTLQEKRLRGPSLDQVLEQILPLPPYTLLIGVAEEGAPLLVDMVNPAPGSFLLAGDVQYGNTLHVKSILSSAVRLNHPDEISIHIISPHGGDYQELGGISHHVQIHEPTDPASGYLFEDLCNLVERRLEYQRMGRAHVLVIDGLDLVMEAFNDQLLSDLKWLLAEGPLYRVWVFATLGTKYFKLEMMPTIEEFTSRIVNRIKDRQICSQLSRLAGLDTSHLLPGVQAYVHSAGELVEVLIPRIGEDFLKPPEQWDFNR